MRAALNPSSGNSGTGKIITTETSSDTCPKTCGQYHKCYAKFRHAGSHWKKLDRGSRGLDFPAFLDELLKLGLRKRNALARFMQWGDQPGDGCKLDIPAFRAMVARASLLKAFSYSHYPLTPETIREYRSANALGYTVNLSADTLEDSDRKALTGLPVVVTLPWDHKPKAIRTPAGNLVVTCPKFLPQKTLARLAAMAILGALAPIESSLSGFRRMGLEKG